VEQWQHMELLDSLETQMKKLQRQSNFYTSDASV